MASAQPRTGQLSWGRDFRAHGGGAMRRKIVGKRGRRSAGVDRGRAAVASSLKTRQIGGRATRSWGKRLVGASCFWRGGHCGFFRSPLREERAGRPPVAQPRTGKVKDRHRFFLPGFQAIPSGDGPASNKKFNPARGNGTTARFRHARGQPGRKAFCRGFPHVSLHSAGRTVFLFFSAVRAKCQVGTEGPHDRIEFGGGGQGRWFCVAEDQGGPVQLRATGR